MRNFIARKALSLGVASVVAGTLIAGPRVTVIGDSISAYSGTSIYAGYYPEHGVDSVKKMWWMIAINAIGGELACDAAWSGSSVAGSGNDAMSSDYRLDRSRLGRSPDLFLICAGTNDGRSKRELGEFTYDMTCVDRTKFRPAFAYMLNWLKTNYPQTKILVIVNTDVDRLLGTTDEQWEQYATSMETIAAHYGIASMRIHDVEKGVEPYAQSPSGQVQVHPTAAGMVTFGNQVTDGCRTLLDFPVTLKATQPGPSAFKFYNIVPFANGNERQTAADIREYRDRTGQDTALYCLTLNPFGKPAIDLAKFRVESFRRLKQELEGSGIRLGVLVQAIIGHGWPSAEKVTEDWQRTVDINGDAVRFCPLSDGFRKYVRETMTMIAEAGAEFVMTDDDCRSFSPETECFCPLHVAAFNRRTGGSYTSETLRQAIRTSRPGDRVQRDFAALQRDTVVGLMRDIRVALDAVDPTIPACCSTPGQNREVTYVPDYARAIARKGDLPMVRINNGYYVENSVREFPGIVLFTMGVCAYLSDRGPVLLDEADTCPQNLWAKSSASFFAHLTASALCGCTGAKVWYVNGRRGDIEITRNYTDVLSVRRGFLDGVVRAVRGGRPLGVVIPCTDGSAAGVNVAKGGYQLPMTCDRWVDGTLGLMGVPFRASFDKTEDAVYALGGDLAEFSDEELKAILAHRVLVDSDAAQALCRRGLSALLGVSVRMRRESLKFEFEADAETGEIVSFSHNSTAPEFVVADGAKVCAWLCGRLASPPSFNLKENPNGYVKIAPSGVLFRNELGGTVLTVAWHSHPYPLERRSEQRQRWLWQMLDRVAGCPFDYVVANPQDVLAVAHRMADGSNLVVAFNLNYDPLRCVLIRAARRPKAVATMDRHGGWKQSVFEWKDGVLSVPAIVTPYDALLVRIDVDG